jgi:hypothetical protein
MTTLLISNVALNFGDGGGLLLVAGNHVWSNQQNHVAGPESRVSPALSNLRNLHTGTAKKSCLKASLKQCKIVS